MKSANIAKFKAELSKYLRFVRKGEEVIIMNRDTPLARVVPIKGENQGLIIEEAIGDMGDFFRIQMEPVLGQEESSLQFLKVERSERT